MSSAPTWASKELSLDARDDIVGGLLSSRARSPTPRAYRGNRCRVRDRADTKLGERLGYAVEGLPARRRLVCRYDASTHGPHRDAEQ